jgi:predicted lipid-binding transport protein (Tim44 family)
VTAASTPAHTGYMSRMIWTILGAILAAWLAFTAIGSIFAMVKTFAVIGLIAVVVFIVVWILAGRARRDSAAR